MKRADAGRLGILIDGAAVCIENTSTLLIELADNAMYKCDEEVVVPNDVVKRMIDCSTRINIVHDHEKNIPETPTLFSNKRLIRSFQFVTMNQGAPTYGEIDPTPIISIIFPIFYGIMFGDLGHGLVLILAGLLLYRRGNDSIKGWGVMFALAGISASIVGIMIGEAFGFSFGHLFHISGYPLIHLIEHGSFNTESVVTLLQISFLLGITHIIIGLVLNIINGIKEKEYTEIIVEKIPKIICQLKNLFI